MVAPRTMLPALALAVSFCLPAHAVPQAAATDSPAPKPRPADRVIAEAADGEWRPLEPENTLYVELDGGRVVIELADGFAPAHVAQMKTLAREKFYDGLSFYRVVEGFVAQAGDIEEKRPLGSARRRLPAEFERPLDGAANFTPLGAPDGFAAETGYVDGFPAARDPSAGREWLVHCPAAVAMARSTAPNTAGTEFYVVLGHAPRYLDRNLSVFGRVVAGMELLQALPRGHGARGVIDDVERRASIRAIRVAADLPAAERTPLEILRTDSSSFAELVAARRNRPETFFVHRPDHIDVCGVPIPSREPAGGADRP